MLTKKRLNNYLLILIVSTQVTFSLNNTDCKNLTSQEEINATLEFVKYKLDIAEEKFSKKSKELMKEDRRDLRINWKELEPLPSKKQLMATIWCIHYELDEKNIGTYRNEYIRYLSWLVNFQKDCNLKVDSRAINLKILNPFIYKNYCKISRKVSKEFKDKLKKMIGERSFDIVKVVKSYEKYIESKNKN